MKTFYTVLVSLLISFSSIAQQGINYKALIKDDLGNVVAGQPIGVQFQIREATANGTAIYIETHTPTTDVNGIMVLNIGTGTTSDTFSAINWSSDDHWLNLQIDITGGTNYTDMSTTQFMAVPYALSAANVSGLEALDEGNGTGWRLKGSDPANYGNIGLRAVDLSFSPVVSVVKGASGSSSTAMGYNTEASGFYSTATGFNTTASGYTSTAMGFHTTAPSFAETAIGSYNTLYTPDSESTWFADDRVFVVGNGSYNGITITRRNALVILKNGTITAPSLSIEEIDTAGDEALITKEYLDNSSITKIDDLSDGKSDSNGSSLFIGLDAGLNDDGTSNQSIGIGINALKANTNGNANTAIGYEALMLNELTGANTAIGWSALRVNNGYENTAIGSSALRTNSTGLKNTAVGQDALEDNYSGNYNTAIGQEAMERNIGGSNNTALGKEALLWNTTGAGNIALGTTAGSQNSTGNNNIFIGNGSGSNVSVSDKLYIKDLIYGEFDTDLVRINGTLEVTEEITTDIMNADVINTEEIHTATTGNANLIPIAYGIVESTGNVLSGTGNFTAFLSGNVFVIDVNGTQSLSYGNTVCLITPISTSPRTASTVISDGNGDSDADLNVRIFDASGTQVTTTFQFIIYKL